MRHDMKILVAPDKFKGSLGAREVAENIAAGLREALPEAAIVLLPIADGGEGTAEVICAAAHGEWISCPVHDANGGPIAARYAMLPDGETAVLETSEAIGLWRIPAEERAPLRASSLGAGEMLLHAARRGAKKLIVGLGGSATNDGGFGMARALGFRFLDRKGAELTGTVAELRGLARIAPPLLPEFPTIIAAVDVQNPLLGKRGATRVFGPQKGSSVAELELLEEALTQLADIVARDFGVDHRDVPGAGAAGGLGFGLLSLASATLRPGFDVVAEAIGLEDAVCNADVVITGEGRMDAQTLEGKAPAGIAVLARRHRKKIYAIVGQLEDSHELRGLFDGISVLSVSNFDEAIAAAPRLLRACARELAAAASLRSARGKTSPSPYT